MFSLDEIMCTSLSIRRFPNLNELIGSSVASKTVAPGTLETRNVPDIEDSFLNSSHDIHLRFYFVDLDLNL